jgi:hypothetical protein
MRNLDFSSWQGLLSTILGLALVTLIAVGLRMLVMQRLQQRRERENRQINERLRTLIAAYRTLGGSFTGDLSVDPTHLRDLRQRHDLSASSERARRIRDAVEAALSDVVLLGTEEQVRLAARAATELAAGRPVHTAQLVVSLRDFIRRVLDLEPVPADLAIPQQGPVRPGAAKGSTERGSDAGAQRGDKAEGSGAAMGAGMGMGMGYGAAPGTAGPDPEDDPDH